MLWTSSAATAAIGVAIASVLGGEATEPWWLGAAVTVLAVTPGAAVLCLLSLAFTRWLRPLFPIPSTPRDSSLRPAAYGMALPLGVALAAVAAASFSARLSSVTERDFAVLLQAVGAVGGMLASVAVVVAVGEALAWTFRRMAEPRRARLAQASGLVLAVSLALIGLGVAFALGPQWRTALGSLAIVRDLAIVACVAIFLRAIGAPFLAGRLGRRVGTVAVLVVFGASALATVAAPAKTLAELAVAPRVGGSALRALRWITDVDGDGFSGVLGGGDCAPFDATRNPAAVDVAADGIDQDCDGRDPPPPSHERVFYGDLVPEQVRRYDVVIIAVEALRADHVHSLGYERQTTPWLDLLAEDSLAFENARSTGAGTQVALAAGLTGRWPPRLPWRGGEANLRASAVTLAERFHDAGYRTVGWVNRWVKGRLPGLAQGFESFEPALSREEQEGSHEESGAATVHRLIRGLHEGADGRPLFLFVYLEDPHHPYRRRLSPPEREFGEKALDRYDSELAYVDRQVGALLEHLRWAGRWDETLVVVTGDHGEEFREHGGTRHARTLYEEVLRVPLVVRVPGLPPMLSGAPVSHIDIAPTVLELTGLDVEPGELDGRSLLIPTLGGQDDSERTLLAELRKHPYRPTKRAVVRGQWKLIRNLKEGSLELYDLAADPAEKTNVAEQHPSVVDELLSEMARLSASR